MTLDEKIRSTLAGAAAAVPHTPSTAHYEIQRRGRRRRTRRRVIWGVTSLVVVIGVLAFTVPFDPNRIDPADTYPVDTIEIADLAVPVVDGEPVLTDPDVWLGLPGPKPQFDVSALGEDLSFEPGDPALDDLDESNMLNDGWPDAERAVYLGELDGDAFYVFSTPAPSIWDRIFEVIDGNFSGDVLGTSLSCCSGGDMDHEEWVPGIGGSSTTSRGVTTKMIHAEWFGLSPDVSVVAWELDGTFLGWQTPVAGVSSIRLDEWPAQYLGVAYDAQGRELDRFGPIQLEPWPDESSIQPSEPISSDAGWAPLESEGTEIEPEEIPTDVLREVISPQIGDRLFSIITDDRQIIVVVRSDGTPHAYATSCDVLGAVDLPPGWEGTCLERTVDGVRQVGEFDYRD